MKHVIMDRSASLFAYIHRVFGDFYPIKKHFTILLEMRFQGKAGRYVEEVDPGNPSHPSRALLPPLWWASFPVWEAYTHYTRPAYSVHNVRSLASYALASTTERSLLYSTVLRTKYSIFRCHRNHGHPLTIKIRCGRGIPPPQRDSAATTLELSAGVEPTGPAP